MGIPDRINKLSKPDKRDKPESDPGHKIDKFLI